MFQGQGRQTAFRCGPAFAHSTTLSLKPQLDPTLAACLLRFHVRVWASAPLHKALSPPDTLQHSELLRGSRVLVRTSQG